MAAVSPKMNPIIVEPTASPDSGTAHHLLNPSLNTSSSSNSFESSRPQSRASSATSPSESSSPIPLLDLSKTRPHTPPDLEPLPPSATLTPSQSPRSRNIPGAPPPTRAESLPHNNAATRLSLCLPTFSRRPWLEHALGVFTLVASLVGLLFIGVRTYKLAVISTENSTLDSCTGLIQAGFATLGNSSALCKTAMKNGPLSSPYHLGKRALQASLALASRWTKAPPKQCCSFSYIGCQCQEAKTTTYRTLSISAIIISTTLALGGLTLTFARRNARSTEVFTSAARSDIQVTRYNDSGPTTVDGQGTIEKHNLEDHHDLGQLRKQIRASQDQDTLIEDTASLRLTNDSSPTLASGCSTTPISLNNRSSGEKHEGLIELQMNRKHKAFLKLDTGELFSLKHWKHQPSDDSGSSSDDDSPFSIENQFAQTGPRASAKAKAKAVKYKLTEELQQYKHLHTIPQQAGDCLAGLVTNEVPTGKPHTL